MDNKGQWHSIKRILARRRKRARGECWRYVPRYCSLATYIRSHSAGRGDGAGEAVACDWLVGESNNLMDAHVA